MGVTMVSEIFYWTLNLSIIGSVAGSIVLLLRRFRVLPRFGIYLLWTLPLVRLWVPVGISNPYSLLNFISRYATKTVTVWESAPELTLTNSIQAASRYFPIEYKTAMLENIFNVAGMIWVIVASAAVFCSFLLYIFTKSTLKGAEYLNGNIYRSDQVSSPAVYGIIRPKIVLPANITDTDLKYILQHERVHIRRRDNLWRIIGIITVCVHWFNPLAWIFLRYFFTDMELACDAGVLRKVTDEEKRTYATALLSSSTEKTYYASAFGGVRTRLRIENILSYKKMALISGICVAVLFFAIAVTVITNAVGG